MLCEGFGNPEKKTHLLFLTNPEGEFSILAGQPESTRDEQVLK